MASNIAGDRELWERIGSALSPRDWGELRAAALQVAQAGEPLQMIDSVQPAKLQYTLRGHLQAELANTMGVLMEELCAGRDPADHGEGELSQGARGLLHNSVALVALLNHRCRGSRLRYLDAVGEADVSAACWGGEVILILRTPGVSRLGVHLCKFLVLWLDAVLTMVTLAELGHVQATMDKAMAEAKASRLAVLHSAAEA